MTINKVLMATIDFAGTPGQGLSELRNVTRPTRHMMAGRRWQRQALSGIVEDPLAKQVSNPQAARKKDGEGRRQQDGQQAGTEKDREEGREDK